MTGLEHTLKAFANKRRLAIVKYLTSHNQGTVGEIASAIKLSFRSTSKHLAILTTADVLEFEQRSRLVFYRISDSPSTVVRKLLALL